MNFGRFDITIGGFKGCHPIEITVARMSQKSYIFNELIVNLGVSMTRPSIKLLWAVGIVPISFIKLSAILRFGFNLLKSVTYSQMR